MNRMAYSCHDESTHAASMFATLERAVKGIMGEVVPLRRMRYFRDPSHMSCMDRVRQRFCGLLQADDYAARLRDTAAGVNYSSERKRAPLLWALKSCTPRQSPPFI